MTERGRRRGLQVINVLVIDDSTTARAVISRVLRGAGYGVHELSSAIGATRTILRHNVSVVLVDLGMPGLSGDRLVGLLRDNPRLRALKIVVVSGQTPAELERIRQSGSVDAVLAKSQIEDLLVNQIASLCAGGVPVPMAQGLTDRESATPRA